MHKTLTLMTALALAASPTLAVAQSVSANVGTGSSGIGVGANISARIATAKQRADKEITRRVNRLNALITRLNGATHISTSDKAALVASMNVQISTLQSLQTQIASDDSTTTLRVDIQSITKSYRIFMLVIPQAALMAAADRVNDIAAMMTMLAQNISSRLASTPNAAASAALSDMQIKVSDATSLSAAAIAKIVNLTPDNGNQTVQASNTSALKDARNKVQSAQQDLVIARKDITTILRALKASGDVSTTSSTTARQ